MLISILTLTIIITNINNKITTTTTTIIIIIVTVIIIHSLSREPTHSKVLFSRVQCKPNGVVTRKGAPTKELPVQQMVRFALY